MKRLCVEVCIGIITAMILAASLSAQTAEELYQDGLLKESGEGNLQEAISIYQQIVADESADDAVKAKAQLHIGLCYEKMGKTEAIKAYELVLQNYQNFEDEVYIASLRLAELNKKDDDELSVIKLYEKGPNLENSSLSPDGTKLAGIEFSIGQNVNVHDRLKNETRMITKYEWLNEDHGVTYYPIWSPDGKEIAYQFFSNSDGLCELRISTLDGVTRTLHKNAPGDIQIIPRQWSQDGKNILAFKQDSSGSYTIGLVSVKEGSFKALHKTQWTGRFVKGSASLSPDRQFVVFADGPAHELDLFIIDTQGGTPTVLSEHPANEFDPLWSPDGGHIAFIRETEGSTVLFGISMLDGKAEGQPFLIKEGMRGVELRSWSGAGITYVLFLDLREIYTMPLNPETGTPAGEPKPVDYTPSGSNICPVWSHDGKHLAFISVAGKPKVVIVPADGGEARRFTIPTSDFWAPGLHDLRWLPDNSGVGFSTHSNTNGAVVHRLDIVTGQWQDWTLPIGHWTRTDWGPDKNSFVFAGWIRTPAENDSDAENAECGLYQFNIETGGFHSVFRGESDTIFVARGVKFSRDHKKLTFLLNSTDLMVVDLETGMSQVLDKRPWWVPTFSSDGQKILACGQHEESKTPGIVVFSREGEILNEYDLGESFTSGTTIRSPDWSPDGTQLLFNTRNTKYETYLMKNVLR
ncbi:MAG: PD40 domain-containing protein [Candidatus Zixiibacteriota bacterium]|nr:MAG: PD40 domain-containing protein [candidate division Zixibacteria bacterium]